MSKHGKATDFLTEHEEWVRHAQNPHYNLGKFDSFRRRQALIMRVGNKDRQILFYFFSAIAVFCLALYLSSHLSANITLWATTCIGGIIIPLALTAWGIILYQRK